MHILGQKFISIAEKRNWKVATYNFGSVYISKYSRDVNQVGADTINKKNYYMCYML